MSGLFSKPKAPPPIPDPVTAPDPGSKQARRSEERKAQMRYASSGRASTILSDESKLG